MRESNAGKYRSAFLKTPRSVKSGSRIKTKLRISNESGFGTIEATVVILVIGIVAAISLPAMSNSIDSYTLRSAATHVAERVSYARAVAMEKNTDVGIAILRSGEYGLDFDGDGVPETTDPDDPSQAYVTWSLPANITIPASAFPAGKDYIPIRFNSRGELPIGDAEVNIEIHGTRGSLRLMVNLRGKVWVR